MTNLFPIRDRIIDSIHRRYTVFLKTSKAYLKAHTFTLDLAIYLPTHISLWQRAATNVQMQLDSGLGYTRVS